MAGQRQPGSWGLEPSPAPIDQGTSCRIRTPPPGPIGLDGSWSISSRRNSPLRAVGFLADTPSETLEDLKKAVADFQRSESWFTLQPVVSRLLGRSSFGLGVVYGIGENVVTSVVELVQLVKTFLLADMYDRAHQPVFSAALNPIALFQRLMAEVSMRSFSGQLEEAHRERAALIDELRYAMTHIGEVLGHVKEGYVAKWNRFETLVQDRTLSSQFQAGRIFGEVLIEVVSVIGGGTAAVRAASKIPKLAKLARLKIPAKSTAYAGRATGGAAAREMPATPSQVRPAAPVAEAVPKSQRFLAKMCMSSTKRVFRLALARVERRLACQRTHCRKRDGPICRVNTPATSIPLRRSRLSRARKSIELSTTPRRPQAAIGARGLPASRSEWRQRLCGQDEVEYQRPVRRVHRARRARPQRVARRDGGTAS